MFPIVRLLDDSLSRRRHAPGTGGKFTGSASRTATRIRRALAIAAEVGGPPSSFHEIPVNRSLKGGVLREDAAFEREEGSHRMEGGVVRTGSGAIETAVRKE